MSTASQARIDANRQNAQHSTGPRTEAGKQKSSLNSVRHGFTGQTIILPADQVEAYQNFTEGLLKELSPVGIHETALAHSIMSSRWRMHQIAAMESAIYALGFREHGAQFSDETPEMAAAMARAITFDKQRLQLERLRRYESQMARQAKQDQQLLTQLQTARQAKAAQQEKDAIALHTHFTTAGKPWNPADFGFVLSIEEIKALEERQFLLNRVRGGA